MDWVTDALSWAYMVHACEVCGRWLEVVQVSTEHGDGHISSCYEPQECEPTVRNAEQILRHALHDVSGRGSE